MNLTDTGRIADIAGISTATELTRASRVIESVSAAIERYIDRNIVLTGYTHTFSVYPGQRVVAVNAYPITAITSISNDSLRSFTSYIDSSSYTYDANSGLIYFDTYLTPGPQVLRISYSGGLGSTISELVTNGHADLVNATEAQVIHLMKRQEDPHISSYNDSQGGTTTYINMEWLPWVRDVLETYRTR